MKIAMVLVSITFVIFLQSCDLLGFFDRGGGNGSGTGDDRSDASPSPVSSLAAAPAAGQVTLTWTDPSNVDIDRVEVAWTPDGGTSQLVTISRGVGTVTVSGLIPETTYSFSVTAVGLSGSRSAAERISTDTLSLFADGPGITITSNAIGARSVYAIDIDLDSDADVISASRDDDRIVWYENTGLGPTGFSPGTTIASDADGAASVFAVDLNADSRPDVLSASSIDDRIVWYENTGSGPTGFSAGTTIASDADFAISVYAADLDEDQAPDVLTASASSSFGAVVWHRNRLASVTRDFTSGTDITPTSGVIYSSVYAADLDGDGDADVLSGAISSDAVMWYENRLNEASGDFGPGSTISDAGNAVFAADLDGDGDADVLVASRSDDRIAWHENTDGAGTFSSGTIIAGPTLGNPVDFVVAVYAIDLDGDGDADVLSASSNDDRIVWYENTGNGPTGFSTGTTITSGASGAIAVYATDLDGDGDIDVLSASRDDNRIAWYENRLVN